MKKFKIFILILFMLPCVLIFPACSSKAYVVNIEKTGRVNNEDIYTVTYSNGSYSTFNVEQPDYQNNITIEDVYNAYKQHVGEIEFSEFLKIYFTDKTSTNTALKSAVEIVAAIPNSQYVNCGAGVVYKMEEGAEDVYLITNYHVLSDDEGKLLNGGINLCAYGSKEYVAASYVGGSQVYDIAVIKCKKSELLATSNGAKAADIAKYYSVGDSALAIGNPGGEGLTVTNGIVGVDSTKVSVDGDGSAISVRAMKIDTAVYEGNSGGGLFNTKGELIGIVSIKTYSYNNHTVDNIAYALPIDNVTRVADTLIYNNLKSGTASKINKLNLKVKTQTQNSMAVYYADHIAIEEEVVLSSVYARGVAEKIGLHRNDVVVLLKINNEEYKINRDFQLDDLAIGIHVGDTIQFSIKRDGTPQTLASYVVTESDLETIN